MNEAPSLGRRFGRVQRRNTADYMLRTAQQHHQQISAMADTKANILITVSSIVLTLALGRLGDPALRPAVLTLSVFTLAALVLAIVAILPRFRPVDLAGSDLPPQFNLLFFGHFAALGEERYAAEMERVLEDDARVYETLVKDLYEIGTYLARGKYRFLRYSYLCLLAGFVAATAIQVAAAFLP